MEKTNLEIRTGTPLSLFNKIVGYKKIGELSISSNNLHIIDAEYIDKLIVTYCEYSVVLPNIIHLDEIVFKGLNDYQKIISIKNNKQIISINDIPFVDVEEIERKGFSKHDIKYQIRIERGTPVKNIYYGSVLVEKECIIVSIEILDKNYNPYQPVGYNKIDRTIIERNIDRTGKKEMVLSRFTGFGVNFLEAYEEAKKKTPERIRTILT